MLKVFYASDLFTKTYNYIHTWQIGGSLEQGLMKHKMELQRGEVSVFKYHNDITLHNRADKMEVEMVDGVVQTEASFAYRWEPSLQASSTPGGKDMSRSPMTNRTGM